MAADDVRELIGLGKQMLTEDVELFPGAREAVSVLAETYPLILVTKGDLLEIPTEILEDAINLELGDGMVVADTIGERQCVFMKKLWDAERTIAERIGRETSVKFLRGGKLQRASLRAVERSL